MNSRVTGFEASSKFLPVIRLDKHLRTRKGSRRGNSGNRLELQVLTQIHHGSSSCYLNSKMSTPMVDKSSKRSGYEAIQKREQERKRDEEEKKKYGAWGSTFKNKDHFTNMHLG